MANSSPLYRVSIVLLLCVIALGVLWQDFDSILQFVLFYAVIVIGCFGVFGALDNRKKSA